MKTRIERAIINEEKIRKNEESYRQRREKTVYISGAITDEPRYQTIFRRAKQRLKTMGYRVFNPTALPQGLEYQSYLKIGKAIIEEVDTIYMLRGWERSEGAKVEYNHALEWGKEIIFELPEVWDAGATD